MKKANCKAVKSSWHSQPLLILAGGCATTANNPKDPSEGFNRAMFAVNEGLDVVVKPVAQGYDAAAPLPLKVVIGNFFGNIADLMIGVNNLLQGKPRTGCRSGGAFWSIPRSVSAAPLMWPAKWVSKSTPKISARPWVSGASMKGRISSGR